ncbi:MAG: APC family permease [Gemmatirosa sp.]
MRSIRPVPELLSTTDARLDRVIGPWALGANAVNLTVGAGIFALPAVVAGMLGPAAILAYLVCGVLVVLVLGCFAEVGSRVTGSGGAAVYVEEAFGPLAGFLTWVVFALPFAVAADAAIVHVLMDALAGFAPTLGGGLPRLAAMTLLLGVLAAVNVRGVREGTRLSVAVTVAKLLPLLLLVALGVLAMQWRALAWTGWPTVRELGAASLVIFFAFMGAESALTPSGEIRDPARTVPRGMLGAALALVLLYSALQTTAQGVLGDQLAREADAPLATMAERLAGAPGRAMVLACTALAGFGALAADMIGAPRGFLAMAERGLLPAALARVHPHRRTPWVAILAFAGLILAAAASGSFRALAVLSSISLLLVYLGVCLAALQLRRTRPPAPGAFRLPGGLTVPVLAVLTVCWLLAQSTRTEALGMAAVLSLAALYYALRRRGLRAAPLPPAPAVVPPPR